MYKKYYNKYIGWGIPSPEALKLIYDGFQEHLKHFPDARLIDLGAGTGVYSALLVKMGVPPEKMIAIDLVKKTHTEVSTEFHPVLTEFEIKSSDAILVVWGSGCDKVVETYAEAGGTCVIIQGESSDGCTYPTDVFDNEASKDNGWNVTYSEKSLFSLVSYYAENITINTRY